MKKFETYYEKQQREFPAKFTGALVGISLAMFLIWLAVKGSWNEPGFPATITDDRTASCPAGYEIKAVKKRGIRCLPK